MDGAWFVLRMLPITITLAKYLVRNRPLKELDVKAFSIKLVFELDNVRVFLTKIICVYATQTLSKTCGLLIAYHRCS